MSQGLDYFALATGELTGICLSTREDRVVLLEVNLHDVSSQRRQQMWVVFSDYKRYLNEIWHTAQETDIDNHHNAKFTYMNIQNAGGRHNEFRKMSISMIGWRYFHQRSGRLLRHPARK